MNRRVAGVVPVSISLLALAILGNSLAIQNEIKTLEIGESAPSFDLPGVDGKRYRLEDFQSHPILVVIFTCNHCPTAQAYEERIKQMVDDYREQGVGFVAVSPNDPDAIRLDELDYSDLNDSLEEMRLRAEERNFNFPYLYDGEDQEASRAYGPTATPHVFIFDESRKLRYRGRIDDNEREPDQVTSRDTRDAIDALLHGSTVPTETTRTFGCSIKWSDKKGLVEKAQQEWAQEAVSVSVADRETIEHIIRNESENLRLINFWATWCGPCVVEFPFLIEINRMYRGREFEMITISMEQPDKLESVLRFLEKQQASTRNFLFPGNAYELFDLLPAEATGALPVTLLVKPGGKLLYLHEGLIDPLEVKRAIVGFLGNTYR